MKPSKTGGAAIIIFLSMIVYGCGDSDAPARVEQSNKAGRIFDTQRSALEQAKETADFANMRNRQTPRE